MKKVEILAMAVCVGAAFAATASASYVMTGETVKVTSGTNRTGSGGPFKLTVQEDMDRSFETFCIEKNEYISLSSIYGVTVDDAAIRGGLGGAIDGQDRISLATANLYIDWRAGAVTAGGFAGTAADNLQVQNVFWAFEGEGVSYSSLTILGKAIYDTYAGSTGGVGATDIIDYVGDTVRVANLWVLNNGEFQYGSAGNLTGFAQSQLTLAVPEPASVAVWSVLALVFGAGLYRRRRRSE